MVSHILHVDNYQSIIPSANHSFLLKALLRYNGQFFTMAAYLL